MPINEAITRLTEERYEALPVVDRNGQYRGTVSVRQIEEEIRENGLDAMIGSLAHKTPTLAVDQSLEDALALLVRTDAAGLPVVAADDGRAVIGWVTHRDVLRAYKDRVGRRVGPNASSVA